nr:MAG TPA: hypothetical protein [Caudoviricetes sp.]
MQYRRCEVFRGIVKKCLIRITTLENPRFCTINIAKSVVQ